MLQVQKSRWLRQLPRSSARSAILESPLFASFGAPAFRGDVFFLKQTKYRNIRHKIVDARLFKRINTSFTFRHKSSFVLGECGWRVFLLALLHQFTALDDTFRGFFWPRGIHRCRGCGLRFSSTGMPRALVRFASFQRFPCCNNPNAGPMLRPRGASRVVEGTWTTPLRTACVPGVWMSSAWITSIGRFVGSLVVRIFCCTMRKGVWANFFCGWRWYATELGTGSVCEFVFDGVCVGIVS